jgi:hypothetical protein
MPRYRVYRTSTMATIWSYGVDAATPEEAARLAIEVGEYDADDNPEYGEYSTGMGGEEKAEVVQVDGEMIPEDERFILVSQ